MKKMSLVLLTTIIPAMTLLNCGNSPEGKKGETGSSEVVKNDEKESSGEVVIDNQVWQAENLNVDKFRNGDLIQEARTVEEWVKASSEGVPAWCYYENDPSNGDKYGKLYNWYAVNDPRGLAPEGWRIPGDADWTEVVSYLGGEGVAGRKMKSTDGWYENGNGNNESGFNGLPSGVRGDDGSFTSIGKNSFWWSSTQTEKQNTQLVWVYYLDYSFKWIIKEVSLEASGLSVRCIKE